MVAELLSDRVKFKLYTTEQHLKKLKDLEEKYGSLAATEARVPAEMEIDCFFSQIIGAVDSFLVQINDKLGLHIPINEVEFSRLQSELSAKTKKIGLLTNLDKARRHGCWYWLLNEFRNHSLHTTLIPKLIEKEVGMDAEDTKVYFKKDLRDIKSPQMEEEEVIPYLEKNLQQVKDLIDDIKEKEQLLK